MNFDEAKKIIQYESMDGIAYTSRFGDYPSKAELKKLLEALETVHQHLDGATTIDRSLAASLFVISDQVQGNYNGALDKGISLNSDFDADDLIELNELLYAIFEDH